MSPSSSPVRSGPSRRAVLGAFGGGIVGGAAVGAGFAAWSQHADDPASAAVAESPVPERVAWSGASQAGIDRPWTPPSHALLLVCDWAPEDLEPLLARLGEAIADCMEAREGDSVLPDGAGNLTVTVGLGPQLVRRYGPDLPGAEPLPGFTGDERIEEACNGGDLMLLIASDDPGALRPVAGILLATMPGAELRWQQLGMRSPSVGPRARNPLGFHDGVIVPTGRQERDESVWFGPKRARATICVVRRFRLDRSGFARLPVRARERAIGRDLSGAPLSGGAPFSEADLRAKTPAGEYRVPARSHVRAAHPSFTGSGLMLRRSYGYDNGAEDAGLLFISYQRELRSFVQTQQRMDEIGDEMMRFATATASGTFLILPGFTRDRPLGAELHGSGPDTASNKGA